MSIIRRPVGDPGSYDKDTIFQELIRCSESDPDSDFGFPYWLSNYCKVYNNDASGYIYFEPWKSQRAIDNGYDDQMSVAKKMQTEQKIVCLKARQIGQTTIVLLYFLYEALFHPSAFILLLSRGELEAKELLIRTRSAYDLLPYWMKVNEIVTSSKSEWRLSNGSSIHSLSSRRGDSYSATHCLIDEAALLHRANTSLSQVLLNLAPTIGQKGKLFLISKNDKSRPESTFSSIFKAALSGESDFVPAFIPYYVVPGRDDAWYEAQMSDSMSVDGTTDSIFESFPATPEEALAPKSSNKRLAFTWLQQCYASGAPLTDLPMAPDINGLTIYKEPESGVRYILAADPSEGLPTSDPSSITVMDVYTKEEVASFANTVEPAILGTYINKIGAYYNNASVLFESNQHGKALHLWLTENCDLKLLKGWAKKRSLRKVGWEQNALTKSLMYDVLATHMMNGSVIINNANTYAELSSITSDTLRAPKGQHDDRATTFALAVAGLELCMDYNFSIDFVSL